MLRVHYLVITLFLVLAVPVIAPVQVHGRPLVQKGVLDLIDWNWERDGVINLDGQWEFYWNQAFTPSDFTPSERPVITGFLEVPGFWNGFEVNGEKINGEGYATFRLLVENVKTDRILALDIPLMHSAYILWANGAIISRNGTVGKTRETSEPQYLPKTPNLAAAGGQIEFVLQISNFSHTNGGIWQTIKLGTDRQVERISQNRLAFDLFLLGAILIMSLYHFGLFALRRKEKSLFFFGLFCLIVSFRISIHGSTFLSLIFPHIDWELLVKLDYFTLYFGLVYFCTFIYSLFPDEFSKLMLRFLWMASTAFIIFAVVTPALIFTAYLVHYQLIMAAGVLYTVFVLTRSSLRRREGALVVLFGGLTLALTFVNDVLYNHEIIHTTDMIGFGLFILIFSQSFVLSRRFSRAFNTVEILSAELEQKVRERTAAIKDLLDNSGQGFFSFAKNYRIQKYTSKATQLFFGEPIEDKDALGFNVSGGSSAVGRVFQAYFPGYEESQHNAGSVATGNKTSG